MSIDRLRPYSSQFSVPPPARLESASADPGIEECWVPGLSQPRYEDPGNPTGDLDEGDQLGPVKTDSYHRAEDEDANETMSDEEEEEFRRNLSGTFDDNDNEQNDNHLTFSGDSLSLTESSLTGHLPEAEEESDKMEFAELETEAVELERDEFTPELPIAPAPSPEVGLPTGKPRLMLRRLKDHTTPAHPPLEIRSDHPRQLRSHTHVT